MKILIVQEFFPPDVVGGGETLALKLATLLKEKGHEVKVLCTGKISEKTYLGIRTIRIPVNRYLMNLFFPLVVWHARDVDIIQTTSGNTAFPSWIAAKFLRKPVVCYVHHIAGKNWRYIRGPILGHIFQFMEKIFLGRSFDKVIFQNKHSKSIGRSVGIKNSQMVMITPGIDCEKYNPRGIKKENFVLFVGSIKMSKQIVNVKGLNHLLESAKMLPHVKFVVVGGGEYLDELKKESPVNVEFTGPLIGKPLLSMFKKASIFCLPSLSEGFGITILEAMAAGCAIISTIDIGQRGYMIKPENPEEIVNGINYYIKNSKKALSDGNKNIELAKKFTWDRFINSFIRIYEVLTK